MIEGPFFRNTLVAVAILATSGCSAKDVATDHVHMADSLTLAPIPPDAMYIAEDVRFMQGMIAHHGQAIAMTELAARNGASDPLLRFALKMSLSQTAEISLMQAWLREREQAVPDSSAHRHMAMPGMLTAEQLQELAAARGEKFDRLFLVLMIQHHEGALKMVADLFATSMAAQEPDVYSLATDIDIDQRAEIDRMQEMLGNF